MAGEKETTSYLASLGQNVDSQGAIPFTTDDVANYAVQDLTPEQQQAFASYATQFDNPQTGMLPANAYYPDLHHNVGVGNYSGSVVGSNTLFAPGGGLVPLGMMDARDLAIQKAALQKQKQLDDFNKIYQRPVTKHAAIQENLTRAYIDGYQQFRNSAMKKAGGNALIANKILDNDPNFQQWNKGMQDTAKYHDAIVEHSAQLHADEKNPDFVLSPELKRLDSEILSGLAYQTTDPFSDKAKGLHQKFLASKAIYDLDKAVNVGIDKAIPDITPDDIKYINKGKNQIAIDIEREYFSPERIKDMVHTTYMQKYYGTDVSEQDVLKAYQSKVGEKIRRKLSHYDLYHKPDKDEEPDLIPAKTNEANMIFGKVLQTGSNAADESGNNYRDAKYAVYDQATFSKPVKTVIPLSAIATDLTTGKPVSESGNVTAEIGAVGNALVYKSKGAADKKFENTLVDEDAPENVKKQAVYEPVVPVKYTIQDDEGKKVEKSEWVPLKTIENALRGKGGKNQKALDEIKTKAAQRTQQHQSKTAPVKSTSETKKKDPLGLFN